MFDLRNPVANANLTTDFSGSGHSDINLITASEIAHNPPRTPDYRMHRVLLAQSRTIGTSR
ncbi:hypothetical protein L7G72_08330 [Xenorhabdus bovienii]|uniref:hypothetical protein n=1 Tax=Xenorhabdus bovienii TaxID=40576 RepID=UPI001EDF3DA5|nr:hypothetical protein [Xenorhabdus bovienii]MCG3461855.1 hypothetical protein [Xenorhabdus bovienii]